MPGVPPLPSISQETRYGCPPRICVSDCPAVSGVPTTLARSRSRGRSTRLPTSSNYHTEIAFTSRSLFPSWNTSLLSLQNPMSQTSLLLQRSWTSHQYTRLKALWTQSDVWGCQEPPLEEGVVSGIHLSHQPPQSPNHNEFCFPAPVTCNQDTIQKHAPSSHSLSGLPFATLNRSRWFPDLLYTPLCILAWLDYSFIPLLFSKMSCSWSPLSFIPSKTTNHQHSAKLIERFLDTIFSPAICS